MAEFSHIIGQTIVFYFTDPNVPTKHNNVHILLYETQKCRPVAQTFDMNSNTKIKAGFYYSFCVMISITYILVTQITTAHVNVTVTLRPYVYMIPSNLQSPFDGLARVPTVWVRPQGPLGSRLMPSTVPFTFHRISSH